MIDLFAAIERNAAFTPDKPALRFEGRDLTYAGLASRVRAVAESLARAGVGRGDRVAVLAENHPDTLALLYAAARLGAILVPLNWRLADEELAYALRLADPKVLAHGPGYADRAQTLSGGFARRAMGAGGDLADADDGAPPSDGAADDPCLLVFTSGTTGRPKGALITQGALHGNAIQSHHMHQMSAADHILTVLPLFHVGGLNIQTTPALLAGATVTLHARFHPAATLEALVDDRPSLTVLVPATLEALLAEPSFAEADLSSLRAIATGSTIVPEALMEAFEARGIAMLSVYGATETCPIAAYDRYGTPRVKGGTGRAGVLGTITILGCEGRPLPPGEHGEIGVSGPVFCGYFRDEAATRETIVGGIVRTGDIGSLADDGTLTVHDRLKNVIISGGENIYPAEVERVLKTHPAVADCAVVAEPNARWQEVPCAFVVLRADAAADDLIAHAGRALARYKLPRRVVPVQELPRTALGKVRLDLLRAEAKALTEAP